MPSIIGALNSITSTTKTAKLVAIVADYFAYEVFSFAKKLNILSYTFFPASATVLSLCFHSTILNETITCEFRDLQEPVQIPLQVVYLIKELIFHLHSKIGQVNLTTILFSVRKR
jgi:hydroquinone glucosyltransferase